MIKKAANLTILISLVFTSGVLQAQELPPVKKPEEVCREIRKLRDSWSKATAQAQKSEDEQDKKILTPIIRDFTRRIKNTHEELCMNRYGDKIKVDGETMIQAVSSPLNRTVDVCKEIRKTVEVWKDKTKKAENEYSNLANSGRSIPFEQKSYSHIFTAVTQDFTKMLINTHYGLCVTNSYVQLDEEIPMMRMMDL